MLSVAFFLALLIGATASAQGREFVGPGKCTDCHDHRDEKEWSEKRDGDGKGKLHLNALNQLEDARAAEWARAAGLKDVYDAKGACARCHATVVRGSAEFGVTCESCHGAGRDYLRPHQDKGAYAAAISLGMADLVKKPDAWTRQCLSCHVLGQSPGDAAIVNAGHPSGNQFDLSRKFAPVALHWTSKYEPQAVAASLTASRSPAPAPAPAVAAVTPVASAPAAVPSANASPAPLS